MSRDAERAEFVAASGWAEARVLPLAGDASARRYFRVSRPGHSAVLMDDPSDGLSRFLAVGDHLSRIGLHSPTILSEDRAAGLLLLEDLGDDLFARVMERDPGSETRLYRAALDVLGIVQSAKAPDLPSFDAPIMAEIAGLAVDTYAGTPGDAGALVDPLRRLLERLDGSPSVMALRDYHAENLVWCPQCAGPMKVGLLDFQDAVLAHPVYDVVSLLQDARRDVTPEAAADAISYAKSRPHWDAEGFEFAYALLGAQRALRIIGVFARLSIAQGKSGYVDLIPRVWGLLERNLDHPDLADLQKTVRQVLPSPDARHLNDLKARCQTLRTP